MITKDFVCAGKAIFTLEIPVNYQKSHNTKPHYTFRINRKDATMNFPETWFISYLTGPDNTKDYTYLGILGTKEGEVYLTKKSGLKEDSVIVKLLKRVFVNVWGGTGQKIQDAGFDLHHEGRCGRCGRTLTVPESCLNGIGPECSKK